MNFYPVRKISLADRADWLRMREALWPGALSSHDAETLRYFEEPDPQKLTLIADREGQRVGFLELDLRKYVPGCAGSPVPFIEGWYVEPAMRGQGVGRTLVEAAEYWARAAGYQEIGSDTEIDNSEAIAAHLALGYEEIERVVCFRKAL